MKIKKILPNKTTMIKSIVIILLLSLVSTYVTSALSNQKRIAPDNPFEEEVNGFYSDVPLFGGNLDLTSKDEKEEKENEPEEQESKQEDQESEQEEQENEQDKQEAHEKQGDGKKKEDNRQENRENQTNQKESVNKKFNETNDNNSKSSESNSNTTDNDEQLVDSDPSLDENKESEHREIIDREDKEAEDIEDINEFFTTTIKQNEVVANKEFQFTIEQLDHDYILQNLDISIDTKDSKVNSMSEDYQQPVKAVVQLAKGENNISIAATYKDENKSSFTVSRSYTVIYDETEIVIETDLKKQKTSEENIKFTASAKQGEETIPLNVHLHQDDKQNELIKNKNHEYVADLQEGENKFVLSATANQKQAEKIITIHYEKPAPPELNIKTNLGDYHEKTLKDKHLDFTAIAYDGEEVVTLHVSHNDNLIEGNDGTYRVDLQEGSNTFTLKAEKGSYSETSTYFVYYEPEATGGEVEETEPSENEPEITIFDITDGETVKNSVRTFHVKVKNYKGESITRTGKVTVTNNGEAVPRDHTDGQQISFKLAINNGTNEITVKTEDAEGNTASKTITIHGDVDEDGAPIGTATISVEATTVGLGYLVAPHQVELYQGERASYVLDRVLKNAGFNYLNTGSLDSKFYIEAVHKSGIGSNINIPDDLVSTLEEHNIAIDITRVHPDVLGEFDITGQSGWMYSINGVYANVGFADYYLKDGDELRIRFTLAYGNDIGLGVENYHKQW